MSSTAPGTTPLRVLIAQGESNRRQALVQHLAGSGMDVECAEGGLAACVDLATRFGPQVVIVDEDSARFAIPKLCKALHGSEESTPIPIVACLTEVSSGQIHRLEEAGVVEMLAAPTDPVFVAHCIDRLAKAGALGHCAPQTGLVGRWALERAAFEASLRAAQGANELSVHYQPRVDAASNALLGMECLVRWNHPQFGAVAPDQFIPLAEETGLIVPIGEWVLREACRQTQQWRHEGHSDLRVSVNLSAVQFQDADLYETVKRALTDSGLPAANLELEVTESTLMGDISATVVTLERLKDLGVYLSIDDFGTGYSSLSYLKRFPIDALKIDRSFVDEVATNPDDAAIATAIILMGHSLNLTVVGEGVETIQQQTLLRLLGCDEIQGYLISAPLPADRFEDRFLMRVSEAA